MNHTNITTTNLTMADLTFAGVVMHQICPDATIEEIHTATINHMNPFQLLLVACALVALFSAVPLGKKILIYLFDVTGDGRVDGDDVARIARYCCCPCCPCRGREGENDKSNSDADRNLALELPSHVTSTSQEHKSGSLPSDTIVVAVQEAVPEHDCQGETKVRARLFFFPNFFESPFFLSDRTTLDLFPSLLSLSLSPLSFPLTLTHSLTHTIITKNQRLST